MSNNNHYNVIDISGQKDNISTKKYFCNYCRRSLFLRDKETQEFICINCNIIYYPNNQLVKKGNKFDVPSGSDPNVDKSPPIVMMDNPNKELSSTTYKQQKLPEAYRALKGFHWTYYEER